MSRREPEYWQLVLRHALSKHRKAIRRVLQMMADEDEELVHEGREWWVGLHRTSGAVSGVIIKCALVKDVSDSGDSRVQRYSLSAEGERWLKDETYIPLLLRPSGRYKEGEVRW